MARDLVNTTAKFDAVVRELEGAKKTVATATAEAKKSSEEAAELRGKLAKR